MYQSQFIEMFGTTENNHKRFPVISLKDIVESINYGTSKPATENGSVPYLRMNNITYDGFLDLSEIKYINLSIEDEEKSFVQKGDLMFNRTNTKEFVGKTCVYDQDTPMVIAGYIIRVRFKAGFYSEYVSGYLNSQYGKKRLREMAKGAVHQANINAQEFQSIPILNVPEELQKQYIAIVKQADKSKFVDCKSQFIEMFVIHRGKDWKALQFTEFASVDVNMTSDFETYANVPHIGIDSIHQNTGELSGYRTVAEDNVKSGKYIFTPNHIIYSKIRPNLNKVAEPDFHGLCSADAYPILAKDEICRKSFLVRLLRSNIFLEYIIPLSNRTGMPKVNREQVESFSYAMPPTELQDKFLAIAQQADKSKYFNYKS